MDAAEVHALVARARVAQKAWGALTVEQRCTRLAPVKALLVDRLDDFAEAITRENGKTIQEAYAMELTVALELLRVYLRRAPKVLRPHRLPRRIVSFNRGAYLHWVPKGVVGIISPWNFPFSIPFGEVVFSLLAGNAVVLKPSEITPLIALKTRELFVDAGLDPELFHVATGRGATGAALMDAPVNHVCFTGSVATGRRVGEACGRALIPCTLELGGKAPALVLNDANIERASHALLWGAFGNHGQVCASVERVYADERIYPQLKDKIVERAKKLTWGDPLTNDVGACTFPPQMDKIRALLQDAKDKGAVFETGGIPEPGARAMAPTVLTNVNHQMRIMHEESFGPVLPIMSVKTEQEAIEHANDSDLGLLAYVFTTDGERGRQIAEQVQAGTVMINDVLASFSHVDTPWQGVKASGIGRTHSDDGLRDMCESRHVNYDVFSLERELWWYPYTPTSRKIMRGFNKVLYGNSLWDRIKALLGG